VRLLALMIRRLWPSHYSLGVPIGKEKLTQVCRIPSCTSQLMSIYPPNRAFGDDNGVTRDTQMSPLSEINDVDTMD